MINVLVVSLAIALDFLWGEWRRLHPMAGCRRWVCFIEARLYPGEHGVRGRRSRGFLRFRGVVAAVLVVAPVLGGLWGIGFVPAADLVLSVLVLCLATGAPTLFAQARAVLEPLMLGDLAAAREAVARISHRQVAELSESDIARVAIESVLERGSNRVFGSLFWFFVGGIPGLVLYLSAKTLSVMWDYRNVRYHDFGWFIAGLDHVLSWAPSRLTACTYTLLGNVSLAWRCWRNQAVSRGSLGAGPVMAAGAGSLGVRLGGPGLLHGEQVERPWLGAGRDPQAADIRGALFLVQQGLALWLVLYCVVEAVIYAAF